MKPLTPRSLLTASTYLGGACHAHASQSPDRFYAIQEQVTRFRGMERGSKQAEAFIRHVQSPNVSNLPISL